MNAPSYSLRMRMFSLWAIGAMLFVATPAWAASGKTVPILMYHYIENPAVAKTRMGKNLSVAPATLQNQLSWLRQHGYETVTFHDWLQGTLPKKPVMLTFDDGYSDAYVNAFPLLKAQKMKGVFYIITDFVGKKGYLTWPQIEEMRDAGMEMGAHTEHHPDLRKIPLAQKKQEILGSIATLQKQLNISVVSFAYPSGKYDKTSVAILSGAHVPFAVTTKKNVALFQKTARTLPRLRIGDKTKLSAILTQ